MCVYNYILEYKFTQRKLLLSMYALWIVDVCKVKFIQLTGETLMSCF